MRAASSSSALTTYGAAAFSGYLIYSVKAFSNSRSATLSRSAYQLSTPSKPIDFSLTIDDPVGTKGCKPPHVPIRTITN